MNKSTKKIVIAAGVVGGLSGLTILGYYNTKKTLQHYLEMSFYNLECNDTLRESLIGLTKKLNLKDLNDLKFDLLVSGILYSFDKEKVEEKICDLLEKYNK